MASSNTTKTLVYYLIKQRIKNVYLAKIYILQQVHRMYTIFEIFFMHTKDMFV